MVDTRLIVIRSLFDCLTTSDVWHLILIIVVWHKYMESDLNVVFDKRSFYLRLSFLSYTCDSLIQSHMKQATPYFKLVGTAWWTLTQLYLFFVPGISGLHHEYYTTDEDYNKL